MEEFRGLDFVSEPEREVEVGGKSGNRGRQEESVKTGAQLYSGEREKHEASSGL